MLTHGDTGFLLPPPGFPKGSVVVTVARPGALPPIERPSYQSASTRLFQDSAADLALRLESEGSDAARALAREARKLAERFIAWQDERPSDEERVATIQQLFDLNRRAAVYLAA
jgi:hypothetical protein